MIHNHRQRPPTSSHAFHAPRACQRLLGLQRCGLTGCTWPVYSTWPGPPRPRAPGLPHALLELRFSSLLALQRRSLHPHDLLVLNPRTPSLTFVISTVLARWLAAWLAGWLDHPLPGWMARLLAGWLADHNTLLTTGPVPCLSGCLPARKTIIIKILLVPSRDSSR